MQTCQYPSESEFNQMTLQVGFVGSDGIVIASDMRVINYTGTEPCYSRESKILASRDALCCWSGDRVSLYAADTISRTEWRKLPSDVESIKTKLRKIADGAWSNYKQSQGATPPRMNRTVMMALYEQKSLWVLEIERH